jgi:hypothetical protein
VSYETVRPQRGASQLHARLTHTRCILSLCLGSRRPSLRLTSARQQRAARTSRGLPQLSPKETLETLFAPWTP